MGFQSNTESKRMITPRFLIWETNEGRSMKEQVWDTLKVHPTDGLLRACLPLGTSLSRIYLSGRKGQAQSQLSQVLGSVSDSLEPSSFKCKWFLCHCCQQVFVCLFLFWVPQSSALCQNEEISGIKVVKQPKKQIQFISTPLNPYSSSMFKSCFIRNLYSFPFYLFFEHFIQYIQIIFTPSLTLSKIYPPKIVFFLFAF